jgi:hypothetical protein
MSKEISRREFIAFSGKGVLGAASLAMPEIQTLPAPVYYYWGEERTRVANTNSSDAHAEEDFRLQNFLNPEDSPVLPENLIGHCTRHADDAIVDEFLRIASAEYKRHLEPEEVQSRDYSRYDQQVRNILVVADAIEDDEELARLVAIDRGSPEYAARFSQILENLVIPQDDGEDIVGIAGVGAIRTADDLGNTYEIEVYNRMTGEWEGSYIDANGITRKAVVMILDTQGDDSWRTLQSIPFENYRSNGAVVNNPWTAEFSHTFFSRFGFPYMRRPEYVRFKLTSQKDLGLPVWPEVSRPNDATHQYRQLANTLSGVFRNQNFAQEVYEDVVANETPHDSTTFNEHILVDIAGRFVDGGIPVYQNMTLDEVHDSIVNPDLPVGFPRGSGSHYAFFRDLEANQAITMQSIWKRNWEAIDLSNAPTGYFCLEIYESEYENRQMERSGIFVNYNGEQFFALPADDSGEIYIYTLAEFVQNFMTEDDGSVSLIKRILIFG